MVQPSLTWAYPVRARLAFQHNHCQTEWLDSLTAGKIAFRPSKSTLSRSEISCRASYWRDLVEPAGSGISRGKSAAGSGLAAELGSRHFLVSRAQKVHIAIDIIVRITHMGGVRPLRKGPAAHERLGSALQVLVEEGDGIRPQLGGRSLAIARPVIGEKGMAGILVHLDRDVLAGALRPGAQFLGLRHGRVLVLLAEHAKQRAVQLPDHIGDRLWPRRCGFGVGGRAMDEPAPAIDR